MNLAQTPGDSPYRSPQRDLREEMDSSHPYNGLTMQDTRYIKYAEHKRNARNDRITVIYPA
jgi:hypothetical protein